MLLFRDLQAYYPIRLPLKISLELADPGERPVGLGSQALYGSLGTAYPSSPMYAASMRAAPVSGDIAINRTQVTDIARPNPSTPGSGYGGGSSTRPHLPASARVGIRH